MLLGRIAIAIAGPVDIDFGLSREQVDIFTELDPRFLIALRNRPRVLDGQRLVAGIGFPADGVREIGIKRLLQRLHLGECA